MTEIKISDEDVKIAALALWNQLREDFPKIGDEPTRQCYEDGRAVIEALVASGWRREAEVLREAADRLGSLLAEAMRTGRENSGINAYSGAGQVIDWLERRASEAEQYVSVGTREGEDQERDEEQEHG
jgi:hypothetical protein